MGDGVTPMDGRGPLRPEWQPRPVAAYVVRAALIVAPFVAGWLSIRLLQNFFLRLDVRSVDLILWLVQAIAISFVVSSGVASLLRRLTPLVALLRMSLVFPDHAPSRFRLALRSGTVKKMLAQPSVRLSSSTQEAAEQAVLLVSHLTKHEPLTRGHSERVRAYSEMIGRQLGLSEDDLSGLRWGALLHDIGKLTVPAEILSKPDKPSAEEWEVLRRHPAAALPLLQPLEGWLGVWLRAASEHHERWDGRGYPRGLAGTEISLPGRITAVADSYDVITSRRSYKTALAPEVARRELVNSSGTDFDPAVVRAFLEAGLDRPHHAGRFGWLLEAPGLSRVIDATAKTAGTAVAAVAVAGAGLVAGPLGTGPEQLAFGGTEQTTSNTIGSDTVPPVEQEPATSPDPTVPTSAEVETSSEDDTGDPSPTTATTGGEPSVTDPADAANPSTANPSTATPSTVTPGTVTSSTVTSSTEPAGGPASTPTSTATTSAPTMCQLAREGQQDLVGADLRDCDLSGLIGSDLDLRSADLEGANLSGARISSFNLDQANLRNTNLSGAMLIDGSIENTNLSGASAVGLVLENVNLGGSDLRSADLRNTTLRSTSFGNADAREANFVGASLVGVNFNDANIGAANMAGLTFTGTEFYRTELTGTNFSNANFDSAVFGDATGVPTGTASAGFVNVTCPDWSFGNSSCW